MDLIPQFPQGFDFYLVLDSNEDSKQTSLRGNLILAVSWFCDGMRAVSPPPGRPSSAAVPRSESSRADLLERLQDSVASLLAAVQEASIPVLELVVPLAEEAAIAVANE